MFLEGRKIGEKQIKDSRGKAEPSFASVIFASKHV
jgi:hypothetical protein